MTPTQYRAALKAASLSQERWADFIGIGRRTSQGYALGETPIHPAVAILLRLMVAKKIKIEDVENVK